MMQQIGSQNSTIARAELDVQISTAKVYPRDVEQFMARAVRLATMDQETAESCFYALERKNRDGATNEIKGASIRLAEIASSCWGNIHCASRIVSNDGKSVIVEAVAWDLETNVKIAKQVSRSILTSTGKTYGNDMQVLTTNAAQSIALRNAILSVVPKALIDRVCEAARKFAVGDQANLSEKRQKLFERYSQLGIAANKILAFFEKGSIQEIGQNEIEYLMGAGTAIKEGWLSVDQAFSVQDDSFAGTDTKQKLELLKAMKSPKIRKIDQFKQQETEE